MPEYLTPASTSKKSSAARGRSRACRPARRRFSARPSAARCAAAGHQLQRLHALVRQRLRARRSYMPHAAAGFFENGGKRALRLPHRRRRRDDGVAGVRRLHRRGGRSRGVGHAACGCKISDGTTKDAGGNSRLPAAARLLDDEVPAAVFDPFDPTNRTTAAAAAVDRRTSTTSHDRSAVVGLLRQAAARHDNEPVGVAARQLQAHDPRHNANAPAGPGDVPRPERRSTIRRRWAPTTSSGCGNNARQELQGLRAARARPVPRRRAGLCAVPPDEPDTSRKRSSTIASACGSVRGDRQPRRADSPADLRSAQHASADTQYAAFYTRGSSSAIR